MFNPIMLSRLHFCCTIMFHILWPALTIGLSLFLVLMEGLYLKTHKEIHYRHVRFWSKLFLLNFGIGVVSGIVMEFEFGTHWARFSQIAGGFFGNILGFEAAMAFAAESIFLAIMMFGWNRVPRGAHYFATCMVAFAATLSAFWIMDANSWMQSPAGVKLNGNTLVIESYMQAVFNPGMVISFLHMWLTCIEISVLVIAGLSAWYIYKKRQVAFFLYSFKIALLAAVIVTPLQIIIGDSSARTVLALQPQKAAAMESHWETNPAGRGAPVSLVAWPDTKNEKNIVAIEIPNLLSVLATHSLKGRVQGLKEFPLHNRPPVLLPYYAFRIMVLLGLFFFGIMLWTVWIWWRKKLTEEALPHQRILLYCWIAAVPFGYIAMEMGWIVREVGRQPWIIYGLMRTSDGVSKLSSSEVLFSLLLFGVLYSFLFALMLVFVRRFIKKGPDLSETFPPEIDIRYRTNKPNNRT